ncbi:PP2C family protein-serine/threonine phosphatase [Haliea sp. E17]|uniref:PP2C family protein-serine/threonine phosphatase n=1 Tax=Haliea sp. E17 TaxID=3401576 RepID=UPI003AAADC4C
MTASYADSHQGHKRSHNEDCFKAAPEIQLWLVADGVGGHANGEVASAIVRDTLVSDVTRGTPLVDSIRHAHEAILQEISRHPTSNNMGSTVVALQSQGSQYEVAWVGDSRAYLFNGETLRQLTRDHNPVSELLARGIITAEQAAHHPERNVLSQSLGVSESIRLNPERVRGESRNGEQFLLCSDGLTDELPDELILTLMREHATPEEQVGALIKAALDAGGRDNITAIVVGEKKAGFSLPGMGRERTQDSGRAVSADVTRKTIGQTAWMVLAVVTALALVWLVI